MRNLACAMLALVLQFPAGAYQADEKLKEAQELQAARQFEQADAVLREFLKAEPEHPEANYLHGLGLLELKRFKEAEEAFLAAQKSAPETRTADAPGRDRILVGLARAYLELKELEKAESVLREAEQIRQDNAEVYYYRGVLAAHNKDYAAAARDMDKAIEIDPENAYAYYYAGIAYNQVRKPDMMVKRFQTFLKLAPEAPEAGKVKALLRTVR